MFISFNRKRKVNIPIYLVTLYRICYSFSVCLSQTLLTSTVINIFRFYQVLLSNRLYYTILCCISKFCHFIELHFVCLNSTFCGFHLLKVHSISCLYRQIWNLTLLTEIEFYSSKFYSKGLFINFIVGWSMVMLTWLYFEPYFVVLYWVLLFWIQILLLNSTLVISTLLKAGWAYLTHPVEFHFIEAWCNLSDHFIELLFLPRHSDNFSKIQSPGVPRCQCLPYLMSSTLLRFGGTYHTT